MLIVIPLTMVPATLILLRRSVPIHWRRESFKISAAFVITSVVIDTLFWIIWRQHDPIKWFLSSNPLGTANAIGYLELAIIPIMTERVAEKYEKTTNIFKTNLGTRKLAIIGFSLFATVLASAIILW